MPDYQEMYLTLFRQTTNAIELLQKAQQITEEMYISSADSVLRALPNENVDSASSPE